MVPHCGIFGSFDIKDKENANEPNAIQDQL